MNTDQNSDLRSSAKGRKPHSASSSTSRAQQPVHGEELRSSDMTPDSMHPEIVPQVTGAGEGLDSGAHSIADTARPIEASNSSGYRNPSGLWRQGLYSRGLSVATIDHFRIGPLEVQQELSKGRRVLVGGWVYPIHPTVKEKRWKKSQPSDPGPKYRWVWNKPSGFHFYDVDGKLAERVRQAGGVLYLTSGEADVWALWEAGIQNATCLLQGENQPLPADFTSELIGIDSREVRAAPDCDQAGRTWAKNLDLVLSGSPIQLDLRQLPYPKDSKADVGKYLLDVGPENFAEALERLPRHKVDAPSADHKGRRPSPKSKAWSRQTTSSGLYERWCVELLERAAIRAWHLPPPNGKQFSARTIRCPNPAHSDTEPSASWNYRTHQLKCFGCEHEFKRDELADMLGVEPFDDYKARHRPTRKRTGKKSHRVPSANTAQPKASKPASLAEGIDDSDLGAHEVAAEVEEADVASLEAGQFTHWLAEKILETEDPAKNAGGLLHHRRGGAYRPGGEQVIHQKAKQLLNSHGVVHKWSGYRVEEVVKYIRVDRSDLWTRPPEDVLNVQNGLLEVDTRTLKDHAPEHLSTVQLPVIYNPKATCPYWEQFCQEVFPKDAYEAGVPWQIAAWLMLPITSLRKALLLLGAGANGKSRYLEGLASFLGQDNVSRLELQAIEEDRFAVAGLEGKLANICAELPTRHLAQATKFKQLTGGDRRMWVDRKFVQPYEIEAYVRLVLAANQPPITHDNSDGFHDRWIVLPFTQTFHGQARTSSQEIDAALAAPAELSGLLNKALDYLPLVREHGITETPSMLAARSEFRKASDPLAAFLDDYTVVDALGSIPTKDLRDRFKDYAQVDLSPKAFTQALRRLRPETERRQEQRVYVYKGIRWSA